MMDLTSKSEIKNLLVDELRAALIKMGEKPFHAKQIIKWLHQPVTSFDQMTDLSKPLRSRLSETFLLTVPHIERKQVSKVDGTTKYLWSLPNGDCVESVLMKYTHGNTLCVSTQVGCRMGCAFCASGLFGLKRNLSSGEILDQVLFAQKESGESIHNIVLMGTGEPLDNYDNVVRFLYLVSCPEGINIGQRHISLSTSGLADRIESLAKLKLQITLSVSLHAPDNESRSRMMPINKRYPIEQLIHACHVYFDTTGRRISFEYAMANGASDQLWQAERLASLLHGFPSHVNLIPLNPVKESSLQPSSHDNIRRFQQVLEKKGIAVTVRRRLGPDIDAACGQLRRRHIKEGDIQ